MKPFWTSAVALACVVTPVGLGARGVNTVEVDEETEEVWLERLFYPRLARLRFQFNVSLNDLAGTTMTPAGERAAELEERIDGGDDDFETRLALVDALVQDEEREEAARWLGELANELREELGRDPEDWDVAAQLGTVALKAGMLFGDREGLNAAVGLLAAARKADEDSWLARRSLAELFFFRATREEDEDAALENIERARRFADEAIEVDEEGFDGHGLAFLCALVDLAAAGPPDPGEATADMARVTVDLMDAADYAEEPDATRAIATCYFVMAAATDCSRELDSFEAFEELTETRAGAELDDADELLETIAGLRGHRRLWRSAAMARWWLARHAGHEEASELFEEALEVARKRGPILEAAVTLADREGDEEAAEELADRLLDEFDTGRAYYVVGRFEAHRGDHEAAIEHFESARDEDLAEATVGLAVSLLRSTDERERAAELLEEALEEDEESLAAHFALGTLLALEDDDDAYEHLETALELAEDYRIRGYEERIEATLEELSDSED